MTQFDDAADLSVNTETMSPNSVHTEEKEEDGSGGAKEPGGPAPEEALKQEEIAQPGEVNGVEDEKESSSHNNGKEAKESSELKETSTEPSEPIAGTDKDPNATGEQDNAATRPKRSDSAKLDRRRTNESVSFKTPPSSPTMKRQSSGGKDHHRRRSSGGSGRYHHSPSDSKNVAVSEWSHQQLAPQQEEESSSEEEEEWQTMPAYAPYDIYDDDNKLIAREHEEEMGGAGSGYAALSGPAKGYTKVTTDDDALSATSLDDNTAYLFKENKGTHLDDDDEDARDPLQQMQTTKNLLDDNQKIAYVGVVRLAMVEIIKEVQNIEKTRTSRKAVDYAAEAMQLWSQKMMVRLYGHMELDSAEQMMIEQLAQHGLLADDLTPTLMQNARVKNPVVEEEATKSTTTVSVPPTPDPDASHEDERHSSDDIEKEASDQDDEKKTLNEDEENSREDDEKKIPAEDIEESSGDIGDEVVQVPGEDAPPPYTEREEEGKDEVPDAQIPSQLPDTEKLDIDIRWTVLCDLFLLLIADSVYDARSRCLLERVGKFLKVPTLDICRFEKRVTEALEMQEADEREKWDEAEHMENRRKQARKRRLMMMGLATVGGGLVIGLSAGLLAPVIGAGLAAGFTTIGVTGTSGFLAGAGGASIIGGVGIATGGTIGVRAMDRRTGAVKTFEYRPLHNNKRVNLIVSVAGWMTGKVDDVRLPFSTVDPVMGDIYSIHWEPEMLTSMGDTINILATEALTQGLQQILGSTILIGLMAALQLPIVLTKLSYLIDNPWSVSCARADQAGLILADSLIDRNLGARPITLVGYSLGSRVIFGALKELANRGALGLIQNVYIFGTPIVYKKDEYLKIRSVVAGRFVNGYANNDWILGYLFRATGGGIARVAGLAKVDVPGIENVDVTEFVPGHMAYRKAMPRLLREVGWEVESDEFTEIEDPDPDNHEKRQRELINEIEEARAELQKSPEKRRFWLFGSKNKKKAQKKEWETYDDRFKSGPDDYHDPAQDANPEGALFDVDALRKEVVEIASQGIEIKELESTMPPMQLNLDRSKTSEAEPPTFRESSSLRETKSYEAMPPPTTMNGYRATVSSHTVDHAGYDEGDLGTARGEENITMSFEPPSGRSSFEPSPVSPVRVEDEKIEFPAYEASQTSVGPLHAQPIDSELSAGIQQEEDISVTAKYSQGKDESLSSWMPEEDKGLSLPAWSLHDQQKHQDSWSSNNASTRPLSSDSHTSNVDLDMNRNVWADEEEDFGEEKEIKLSFE